MAAETIQEFLVALGYKVKQSEEQNFQRSLANAKTAALALGATLTGLVATIAKVAQGYEALYYQSQRVGSSVGNIQAFAYAISQVGGSAAGAVSSLEAVGRFLRTSPGAESFIARLGIQTRDAKGNLRDTTSLLTDLGARFRSMPYYRANAYAGVLGIDERTLQALIRGTGNFSAQLTAMYRAAGISGEQAAKGSVQFMQQLRGLGAALQVLRDKVALSLEHGIGGDIERLRRLLVDNFGRISAVIVEVSQFVIALGEALLRLTGRAAELIGPLIDWFTHLDRGSKAWVETLGALTAAWYLLSRGFLATPLGRVVALGAAILALYDDYKTFKAGGKTLIDWKAWEPGIDAATDAIKTLEKLLGDLWPKVKPYLMPVVTFFTREFKDAFVTTGRVMSDLFRALDDAVNGHWGAAGKDLRQALADETASGREGQAAAGTLLNSESKASGGRFVTPSIAKNEASGYSILRGLGLDRTHALGILGNLEQESSLDPGARNAGHVGLAQWSPERAAAILAQTGIDVRKAGYADQLKALVWEITMGNERGSARQFFKATGLKQAAGHFAMDVERSGEHPGVAGFDNRIANSVNADNRLRFADGAASGGTGGSPHINAPMTTTIHVSGAGNPEQVANSVARKQDWVAASFVRNMGPLAQ